MFWKKKKIEIIKQEKVEPEYIGLVFGKAKVEPDDVIVLETSLVLSALIIERLKTELKVIWPNNRILILEEGLKLRLAKTVLNKKRV